jgi:transposase InsO family protein
MESTSAVTNNLMSRMGLQAINQKPSTTFPSHPSDHFPCLVDLKLVTSESGRKPGIFHSDKGCQFTSSDFVARLQAEEVKISWSGRNRCYDNTLVEKFGRTVKYAG